ncbi:hypothetical protein AGR4C_Lc90016 [Agrobacterium tumefaciens str. Kerr 14]|uniref:Uncharacterized protein n=1 Tax=Agrobacterium tumefaciens str. Kerr 14 TaxID=1183424 RepID=A0A1S7S5D8_AGRTU|nr:hypothetical protein AGR4C_Lc90016 [Agrobacterium tumefaciens str. Kerr 14]
MRQVFSKRLFHLWDLEFLPSPGRQSSLLLRSWGPSGVVASLTQTAVPPGLLHSAALHYVQPVPRESLLYQSIPTARAVPGNRTSLFPCPFR